jgi:hypothetical protein
MDVSVQTDNMRLLREALDSQCDGIRFGSEFCEHLLPSPATLRRAYELARGAGREFTYVTPRLSNAGIRKLEEYLHLLGESGEMSVVVNDFGALDLVGEHPNLHAHLGRQLIMVPARSPWVDQHLQREDLSPERTEWVRELFSSTSLDCQPAIRLYRRHGCRGADVDGVPQILPSLRSLAGQGFSLSVHLQLVPVTFTPRCHTARFLGEESPEKCSKPCRRKAFLLKNDVLEAAGVELYLHGNAVFRCVEPSPEDVAELRQLQGAELVLTMNRVTGVECAEAIDELISKLSV